MPKSALPHHAARRIPNGPRGKPRSQKTQLLPEWAGRFRLIPPRRGPGQAASGCNPRQQVARTLGGVEAWRRGQMVRVSQEQAAIQGGVGAELEGPGRCSQRLPASGWLWVRTPAVGSTRMAFVTSGSASFWLGTLVPSEPKFRRTRALQCAEIVRAGKSNVPEKRASLLLPPQSLSADAQWPPAH
jgi:hypothetical protein